MRNKLSILSKLLVISLISILLLVPNLVLAQATSKKMSYASGANTFVTATLAAPTSGIWNFLTCYRIEVKTHTVAPLAAGVALITVTTNHLNANMTFKLSYAATANLTYVDQLCFPAAVRGKNQDTAISFTGNSLSDNAVLSITLWGYEGI